MLSVPFAETLYLLYAHGMDAHNAIMSNRMRYNFTKKHNPPMCVFRSHSVNSYSYHIIVVVFGAKTKLRPSQFCRVCT
jgi:hypothetical protein